jgi:hypothetical protein
MAPGRDDIDAVLVAYLDGELDPARRHELERRLRDDAALKARLNTLAEAGRPLPPSTRCSIMRRAGGLRPHSRP